MSFLDGLRHKLRTVFRAGDYERELHEELRHHRELDTAQHGDDAARRFGNQTYHMEEVRRMTWLARLDPLKQDLGYAWRSVRRTKGVTTTIVVTLALGIGVNAATFSVLDQLYLRNPTGVEDPDGLRRPWVRVTRSANGIPFYSRNFAYPQFQVMAEASGFPDRFAIMTERQYRLGGTRAGAMTNVTYVNGNYFTLVGARAEKGRFFSEEESKPGTVTRQLVVSHDFWQTSLSGDPAIIGKTIKLDTLTWQVAAVAAKGFNGVDLKTTKVWAPLGALPGANAPRGDAPTLWATPRYLSFWTIVRPPAGTRAADFERSVSVALREANLRFYGGQADSNSTVHLASIIEARSPATARQEESITARLQGVAAIVLLIAVANVVNLLLARAVTRRREIAVRLALGISRGRLIRLITLESVLLALLAAGGALLTAWWGGTLLRSQLMVGVEFSQPPLHAHVVWATIAVALGCGLVAGIIPALQFSKPQLTHDLKDSGRANARNRSRLRDSLVVAQAALSVVLLVGAALCVRTLQNIEGLDIGFDRSRIVYAQVAYEPGGAPPMSERMARIAEAEQRLQGRNGIHAIARAGIPPMGGLSFTTFWWGSDSSASLGRNFPVFFAVSSNYFAATGIRVLRGSTFGDGAAGEGQVVVNEAMAKLMWPNQEAIGQCIRFEKRDAACTTVLGVVSTASRGELIEAPQPQFYLPIGVKLTESMGGTILMVRVAEGMEAPVRAEVSSVLKQLLPMGEPVFQAMNEALEPKYRPWRLGAKLFTGVGLLALIVALVGIYSTVSYSVGQRTHEFGVRVALGARLNDVLNQVVGEGVRVVAIGIAAGVALALASGRLIRSMLFGVEPTDTSSMILAASLMLIVAIVAALIPAWRAARSDPVTALRGD